MTSSHEGLSQTQLPQPIVLVVGDRSTYFSSEVWNGALRAFQQEEDEARGHVRASMQSPAAASIDDELLVSLIMGTPSEVRCNLQDHGWDREHRPRTRRPIPAQLSQDHNPDPTQLRELMRRVLDVFDVCGVIASASADDVVPLRRALDGIDVPLLVTTDSTTVESDDPASDDPHPNELRLMPNNQAQATAMLFSAVRGEETGPQQTSSPPRAAIREAPLIAYAREGRTRTRGYVRDLTRQLQIEAQRLGIRLVEYKARRDHPGPLIAIGYEGHAHRLIEKRKERRLTILSDGCATHGVLEAVRERPDADWWYVARPDVTLEDIGATSFSAIAEASRTLLTWEPGSTGGDSFPTVPMHEVIKTILERTEPGAFKFSGIENVAAAYRVGPVLEETDMLPLPAPPELPPPPRVSADTRGEQRRLRSVGGRDDR